MKLTQRQRLLQAFQERGELYVYEIMQPRPNGLGVAQYNARIKELREEGHQIINQEPGHFVYKSDTAVKEEVMGSGYQKWLQTGAKVFNKKVKPAPEYASIKTSELENRKQIAENWLRENNNHEKYREALTRYESICDELARRNINETLL